jgi:hypothetical protein
MSSCGLQLRVDLPLMRHEKPCRTARLPDALIWTVLGRSNEALSARVHPAEVVRKSRRGVEGRQHSRPCEEERERDGGRERLGGPLLAVSRVFAQDGPGEIWRLRLLIIYVVDSQHTPLLVWRAFRPD